MSDPMRVATKPAARRRWLQALWVLLAVLLVAAMVFGLTQCGGSSKRTVPSEVVLQVVPTPPPPPPPPPEPEVEPEPEPEQQDQPEPEPAPADAPAADAPAGDDLLPGGEGGMAVAGNARSGTGFGRPQDYLRQEIEKCLRKSPALQKLRLRPQRFQLDVGADRRIARIERLSSTGREELDRQLDARVQECVGAMPPDSRYLANSRFTIEISKQ